MSKLIITSRKRIELNTSSFKMLDIVDKNNFTVNDINYGSVLHAFYCLVMPMNANIVRSMSMARIIAKKLYMQEWELNLEKALRIVVEIAHGKCRTCKDFYHLLMNTGESFLVASSYDGYLGGSRNYWGFALMFIRDKGLMKYELKNIISLEDDFKKYINQFIIEDKTNQQRKPKNKTIVDIGAYADPIDGGNDYEPYRGEWVEPKKVDELPDAKDFL